MKQKIVRWFPPAVIHAGRVFIDPAYRHKQRALRKLHSLPRYTPDTTDILKTPIEIVDAPSFLFMFNEIFEQQIYRFRARTDEPYIIDGGANIGLSVIYFKQLYPKSRVLAFEPDPKIFTVLTKNVAANGYGDVELVSKALWSSAGTLAFFSEGADGGRLAQPDDAKNETVKTVRLRDHLHTQVDFLKLDIEGAETEVLVDCAPLLRNVENLFIEYHSFADRPQTLHTIISIVGDAGFRVHIHPPVTSPQPFIHRDINCGMDMQLNIFAFRS